MTKRLASIAIVATILAAGFTDPAAAQKIGIQTNLLPWATGTLNLGVEAAVAPRVTLNATGALNIPGVIYFGNPVHNRKVWHWTASPEVRFWPREAFNGGFVGIHAVGGAFDAGGITLPLGVFPDLGGHRFEGWLAGAGAVGGWQWILSPHWNLETTFGFGWLYVKYDRFHTPESDARDEVGTVHHYFGPTRLGVSFSYLFRSQK